MPEGPEVAVIRDGLQKLLKDKIIKNITFVDGRYKSKSPDGYTQFVGKLPLKITDVKCKGKLLYFEFGDIILLNTLGMSGGWFVNKKDHTHVVMEYYDPSDVNNVFSIYYCDVRRFGTFKFIDKKDLGGKLKLIGCDLLTDEFTKMSDDDFIKKYRKYNAKLIDSVIHDQKLFSGIGNYLKAEILYEAKISPYSKIEKIPDDKLKELKKVIQEKISKSYSLGGASVRNYSDINAKDGAYQSFFKVYGKKKDANGHNVVAEQITKPDSKNGQRTYYVKEVQILYV